MTTNLRPKLSLVACASDVDVLSRRLLASPCLRSGGLPLTVYFNAVSAAEGFNAAMAGQAVSIADNSWLVWVHQDVFLPPGWDESFCLALAEAQSTLPGLAVAGVYGIAGTGSTAVRAGHVLDRGMDLEEAATLPCLADSLDELLFAVKVGSGLTLDPALQFDFYATDLVLKARAFGLKSAVIAGYCEHWSGTPASGPMPPGVVERIVASARIFEAKWAQELPITTPCFHIEQVGDVERFIASIVGQSP
jgi:hypothetical protein